eukprot:TRINITY_DN1617_c0_g1_i1.p1 TRINITY_DN1617_c0_g1~~TRINITY_DN1617_c0_g1_i1.p1  ORF type:complete len:288 (+),score=56.88 TRINITY_DN1617_c0_g1_i1:456-1319(+)
MVRETKSCAGARMCGQYAKEREDYRAAIEFLLIAGENQKAYEVAQKFDETETYAEKLDEGGHKEDYYNIAKHYQEVGNHKKAGRYYMLCGRNAKAMNIFLQAECVDEAIQAIKVSKGHADREAMIRLVHGHLTGEKDGKAKDPNFMFRLYMAIGDYKQAAKIAVLISTQQQRMGSYKVAHGMLFRTHQDLKKQNIAIPEDLKRNLCILHSYILVKSMVKQQDHLSAARMLIRVAKNISKFPLHIVPILTSTVVECARSGLKKSAYDFASKLMTPEFRQNINKSISEG